MKPQNTEGPFNFDGRDVYFDRDKNEFWDSQSDTYLDHEIGLVLIDLYFGHQKGILRPQKIAIRAICKKATPSPF